MTEYTIIAPNLSTSRPVRVAYGRKSTKKMEQQPVARKQDLTHTVATP